jgi:hypothetical protein
MGLTEIQAAQARLYTSENDRRAFYSDPGRTGAIWGLAPPDIDSLLRIPRPQIEAFARSLIAKRRGEVEKILPMTCFALGPALAPLFRRHAERYCPVGVHRHVDDASAFARFTAAQSSDGSHTLPPWTADAARFELARLRVIQSGKPQILLLRHDLRPLLTPVSEWDRNGIGRVPCLVIFRLRGSGQWHMKIWCLKRSTTV